MTDFTPAKILRHPFPSPIHLYEAMSSTESSAEKQKCSWEVPLKYAALFLKAGGQMQNISPQCKQQICI